MQREELHRSREAHACPAAKRRVTQVRHRRSRRRKSTTPEPWFNTPAEQHGGETQRIYTALSRDIIAHECGHALLDAVVPSLYDSTTAESVAIHEGIADLVAVLMALRSQRLRQ